MLWSLKSSYLLCSLAVLFLKVQEGAVAAESCLSDPALVDKLETSLGGSAPLEGSCCQQDVCNIPCPEEVPKPSKGFGIAVALTIAVSFLIGVATIFVVKGEAENYFVAGVSPLSAFFLLGLL